MSSFHYHEPLRDISLERVSSTPRSASLTRHGTCVNRANVLMVVLNHLTLVLELEWIHQSSGQPRKSQWTGYGPLYRPQSPNPPVGKSRRKLHSSDGPTYA